MAQLKSTSVTGNLSVTGNVVASQIIKLDGGINDILFADGSTYNYKNTNADWYYNSGVGYSSWNIGKVSRNGIFTLHKNGGFIDIQVDGTPGAGTPFIIPAFEGRAAVFDKTGLQNASSKTEKIIIAINDNNKKDILRYRTVNQFRADLKLAQVYDYKGTLNDINALKAITAASVGDTYFISSIGESWSCTTEVKAATNDNYTNYWSNLGNAVDLSGYMTLNTNQTITGKKTFTNNVIINNDLLSIKATDNNGDDTYYSIWHTGNLRGNKNCIPKFTEANTTIGDSNISDDGNTVSINANVNICDGKQIYFQKLSTETADYHTGAIMTYNKNNGAIVPLQIYGTKTDERWHGFCVGYHNMGFNILARPLENGLYSTKDNRWILHHKYNSSSGKAEFIELGAPSKPNTELIPYIDLCANEVKIKGEKLSINSTVSFTYNSDDKCIDVTFT